MARPRPLRLSVSYMREYMVCPARYYFGHIAKFPQRVDYPRLCGLEVHDFIRLLYKEKKSDRKFWFENLDKARKAWFYKWGKVLEESKDKLLLVDPEKAGKFGGAGWFCIKNYWEKNINLPDPVLIEKRYTIPWSMGVVLTGIVDQVRTIKMESIAKLRPEIVNGEGLSSQYNPEYIMDLKTGYNNYDIDPDFPDSEKIRIQFSLQRDLQASAYALLYQKHNKGKLPIGFLLYHLRDNKTFFVKGDEEEPQKILKDTITHIIANIHNESFPKSPGNHCRRCDYVEACIGNTDFSVSFPTQYLPYSFQMNRRKSVEDAKQLRFKFRYKKE